MNYLFYAWIASIISGVNVVISKLTSKYTIANPWLFNFLWAFFTLIFNLPFVYYYHISAPVLSTDLVLASFTNALVYIFYLLSLYRLDVSILSPLFNVRSAFAIILGILFLNESVQLSQIPFIGLIFLFGFLVCYDEKLKLKAFFQPSIIIAVLLMLALALQGLFTNRVSKQMDLWSLTFWINFLTVIFLLPTYHKFKKDLLHISLKQLAIVCLISCISLITMLASNKAFSENIGVTSIIFSLPISMVLVFVFSLIAPQLLEKHPFKVYAVRFASAIIMIYSALRLSTH